MSSRRWQSVFEREGLPSGLNAVVLYRLITSQLLDTNQYIFKLVHESFHALQGRQAKWRLALAEMAVCQYEEGSYFQLKEH